jgi:hypothetical protein
MFTMLLQSLKNTGLSFMQMLLKMLRSFGKTMLKQLRNSTIKINK